MAAINGETILLTIMLGLSGSLNKPDANWSEIDIHPAGSDKPAIAVNIQGELHPGSGTAGKISPDDFFRLVEIAPKAMRAAEASKEPPDARPMLHIKGSSGNDYYFVIRQEHIENSDAQTILDILNKYRKSGK